MDKKLRKDLRATWHQIDEALLLLEEADTKDIFEVLPTVQEHLAEARAILGSYVAPDDSIEEE